MRYLLDDEVERVYAEARRHINTDNEDLFAGMLRFRGGTLGLLEINWLTPTKERTLQVLCERGMFAVDYNAQSLSFYENFAASAREDAIASVTEGPMTRYPIAYKEPLRAEIEAFRDAVIAGGPPPVSAEDGIAAIAVADALVRSSLEGRPLHVAEAGLAP
jgi:predicted dehydrogenase